MQAGQRSAALFAGANSTDSFAHGGRYSGKQEKGAHAFHQTYREPIPAWKVTGELVLPSGGERRRTVVVNTTSR